MKPGKKRSHVPVSPIALGIGVVVIVLGALAPGRADAAQGPADARVPGESSSISVR